MSTFTPVTHVIFDMDGLLLDTEKLCTEIFKSTLAKHGATYTKDVRVKVMGSTDSDTFQTFINDYKLPISVADFSTEVTEEFYKRVGDIQLLPGVVKLISHLKKNNVPIAVASSSSKEFVQTKIEKFRHIFDMFHHITCGGSDPEVKRGKPAPDVFLVCASGFSEKPLPQKCLVFEDAPNGVQAAVDAGMQVVMIPDPIVPEDKRKLATKVLSSLLEFKPEEFGLPKF